MFFNLLFCFDLRKDDVYFVWWKFWKSSAAYGSFLQFFTFRSLCCGRLKRASLKMFSSCLSLPKFNFENGHDFLYIFYSINVFISLYFHRVSVFDLHFYNMRARGLCSLWPALLWMTHLKFRNLLKVRAELLIMP